MMRQPDSVEIKMADGIFVKSMSVHDIHTVIPQHSHSFSHLSMLAVGSVRVWKDGDLLGDYVAPCGIFIEAHSKHKFMTLEADTLIYCIHNLHGFEQVDIAEEHHLSAPDLEGLL